MILWQISHLALQQRSTNQKKYSWSLLSSNSIEALKALIHMSLDYHPWWEWTVNAEYSQSWPQNIYCYIQRTWCQSLLSAVLFVHFEVGLAQCRSCSLYQSSLWHAHTAPSTVLHCFYMVPGSLKRPWLNKLSCLWPRVQCKTTLCLWSSVQIYPKV